MSRARWAKAGALCVVAALLVCAYRLGRRRELARYGDLLPENVLMELDGRPLTVDEFHAAMEKIRPEDREFWRKDPEGFAEEILKWRLAADEARRRGMEGSDDEVVSALLDEIRREVEAEFPPAEAEAEIDRRWGERLDGLWSEAKGRVKRNAVWMKRWRESAEGGADSVSRAAGKGRPVMADFGRGICTWCKEMEEVINRVRPDFEDRVTILTVNIDEEPAASRRWKVRALPYQVFLDASGEEVWRHGGKLSEEELREKLTELAEGRLVAKGAEGEKGPVARVKEALAESPFWALLLVFIAGLMTAANPCVLASVPLLVGFVGGYSGGVRRAFLMSSCLLLGLATTFSLMGMAAGLTGKLLGELGFESVFTHVVVVVCVLLGTHFAGLWRLSPGASTRFLPKKLNYAGAYLFGLVFGVISTPCAVPVVALVCTLIAMKGSLLFGAAALFVYSVGHSVFLLAAGTSVGVAQKLLESKGLTGGVECVKRAAGALLIAVGLGFAAGLL